MKYPFNVIDDVPVVGRAYETSDDAETGEEKFENSCEDPLNGHEANYGLRYRMSSDAVCVENVEGPLNFEGLDELKRVLVPEIERVLVRLNLEEALAGNKVNEFTLIKAYERSDLPSLCAGLRGAGLEIFSVEDLLRRYHSSCDGRDPEQLKEVMFFSVVGAILIFAGSVFSAKDFSDWLESSKWQIPLDVLIAFICDLAFRVMPRRNEKRRAQQFAAARFQALDSIQSIGPEVRERLDDLFPFLREFYRLKSEVQGGDDVVALNKNARFLQNALEELDLAIRMYVQIQEEEDPIVSKMQDFSARLETQYGLVDEHSVVADSIDQLRDKMRLSRNDVAENVTVSVGVSSDVKKS